MMRRAARRASRHYGRAQATAARQLTLDLGEAPPELFAVGAPGEAREASADPSARPGVFDATDRLARAAAERSRASAPVSPRPAEAATAEQWFDLACELEAESRDQAQNAYLRALALEPKMSDAHVNLGRLYHEAGEHEKAEAHYRAAAQHAPRDPIAWFNLGVLLEDLRRSHDALHAYHAAIERDDDHADAHYNLGLLYDELGQRSEAMSHLMQARRLYSLSQRQ